MTQPLDSSCFGALKRAWVEECHRYVTENPGRVVTRFEFSRLFHNAWDRSMTMVNVTAGFRATGVYPFSRNISSNPVPLNSPFNPASLAEKTGLGYIPHSPSRTHHVESHVRFTAEEVEHFQHRFEEGYDLDTNQRYNQWVQMYHPESQASNLSLSTGPLL